MDTTSSTGWYRRARRRIGRATSSLRRRPSESARARLELLSRIGELNEMELDTATRLEALIGAMLPDIADACAIFLIDGEGLHLTGARHVDPALDPSSMDPRLRGPVALSSTHPGARAVRSRQPVLDLAAEADRGEWPHEPQLGSLLSVPLLHKDEAVGALLLGFDGTRQPSVPDDVTFAVELARRVASSLETGHRHEHERSVAETLQASLLPNDLPRVSGFDLAARYIAATRGVYVGGDWYDVVALDDGSVAVAIGDVVGHGLAAANAMGQLRAGLHLCMIDGLGPARALERLNRYAFSFTDSEMATVQIGVVDAATRRFRFASAGHPPPLVVTNDSVQLLDGGLGVPLLASHDAVYEEAEILLPRGAVVLLYTDGLVERRAESLTIGLERLVRAVPNPVGALDDALDTLLEHFLPDGGEDDVALVAVRPTHTVLVLELDAAPSTLLPLRVRMREWLEEVGADATACADVLVAVNEAAANVIEHAYDGAGGRFRIDGEIDGADVVVAVTDSGRWQPATPSDERGRGILLMRGLMHDVTVTRGSPELPGTTVQMRHSLASSNGH